MSSSATQGGHNEYLLCEYLLRVSVVCEICQEVSSKWKGQHSLSQSAVYSQSGMSQSGHDQPSSQCQQLRTLNVGWQSVNRYFVHTDRFQKDYATHMTKPPKWGALSKTAVYPSVCLCHCI